MTKKTKLIIISVISVLAFLNAFYLWYDWIFSVEKTESLYFLPLWATWSSFCDINETLSCSAVLSNPLSQIYWVPFPIIALFVYPIIFLVAILWMIWKIKNSFKILAIMWISWMMFNWYFIFQETFRIWAFCPLCLICSLIITTIFTLSFLEVRKDCKEKKLNNPTCNSCSETKCEKIENNINENIENV